jgi:predicted transcriptional regulator
MRIAKNEKINNIPLVKIRDYFQNIRDVGISKMYMGNHFNLNANKTNALIKELIQNGFIENNQDKKNGNEYQLTSKGQSLCAARSIPPLNKAKADKIFKEFMMRVEEINNNNYYLCKVEKLLLFGSYLISDNEDFGDIDIAFELKRKIDNIDDYKKARMERILEMKQKGKHFADYMEEMSYPEREVELKLKNKCRYISLHSIDDGILKTAKFKQIYPIEFEKL